MHTACLLPISPSMHCSWGSTWLGGVCTWSQIGVPGPGGCTWSWGVYLVPGGVPGPRGCTWSGRVPGHREGVPGPRGVPGPGGGYLVLWGCTWPGVYLILGGTWSWGCTWSQTGVPGPRGIYLVRGRGTCPDTPPSVNRILDKHFWKYYLDPNFVCRW